MNRLIKLCGGIVATALLLGCTTPKKVTPVPKIQSALAVHKKWSNRTGQARYAHFAPQLIGEQIVDAGNNTVKVIAAQNGSTHKQIKIPPQIGSGIGSDGRIFVLAGFKGELYSYDEQGQLLWQVQTSSAVIAPAVITASGRVIVRTIDGRITAYAQHDGTQQWQFVRPVPALSLRNYAPVTVVGGLVFAGLANGQIIALAEDTGSIAWETYVAVPRGATELDRAVDVLSRPIVIGQHVCAAAYQGRIACFNGGSGAPIWARDLSSVSDLTTDGNRLFAVSSAGDVVAFDAATGKMSWRIGTLNGRELGAPVVSDQYVVFGDQEGYVYFLATDSGEIKAIHRAAKSAIHQQPIVYQNNVMVKTVTGDLVALTYE